MKLPLAYGEGYLDLDLSAETDAYVVSPREGTFDPVRVALAAPMGLPPLQELVKPGQRVAIVTSDVSRPCPSHLLLPPLLDELVASGVAEEDILVVFALGTHRPHSEEERRKLAGEETFRRVRCIDSDPDQVVRVGVTRRGTPVDIFTPVAQADVRIALGNVEPHYFAGFSGGSKAIVPGVCSAETIRHNHRFMVDGNARAGVLDGNPVREDIEEAAALVGVDFILNVILDGNHQILAAAAGHPVAAHRWLCKVCSYLSLVPLQKQADVVVVSSGGYPKDTNLYQAQKALDNAAAAVRPGGTIVWVAECPDGMGNATLEKWISGETAETVLNHFAQGFVLGGHKAAAIARVARHAHIEMVSALAPEPLAACGIAVHSSLSEAMEAALARVGPTSSIVVMPEGASALVDVASAVSG